MLIINFICDYESFKINIFLEISFNNNFYIKWFFNYLINLEFYKFN